MPWKTHYSINHLKRFISDDRKPVIAFYGGEPLLNTGFIKHVLKQFPAAKFVIQSNGILARELDPEYWLEFDTVLLSIDGRRIVTDHYRGPRVYDRVVDCARWLRKIGYNNDLIARMTVSELSDIFLDVRHLASLNLFDHIHWQLDVVWSSCWESFYEWCESSYMHGVCRLVNQWIEEARKGRVTGLVPFLAILRAMIRNVEISCPPCGAGVDSVSILTDGSIISCPIAVDVEWAKLGSILKDSRADVVKKARIGEPCTSCNHLRFCGGRCLYAHNERLWGQDGFNKICEVTIRTIDELAKIRDEVLNLLDGNVISMDQLEYPLFNNTTELIP